MTEATVSAKKKIQVSLEEGGTADVTINGTKVAEISPDGNIVTFTDKGIQLAKAEAATKKGTSIDIGEAFNTVAVYGAKVELAANGSLIVYTNGKVFTKPALANDTSVEALKIGMKMKDGTYYVGVSPDTKQAMYAAPSDAPLKLSFKKAADYAQDLEVGGKKGFRVPSEAELNVVRDALLQNKEMKKTFNLTGSDPDGWYWSSTPGNVTSARCQRLSDGDQSVDSRDNGLSVRPVRS
jgi:hypothetical protein